MMSLVAVIIFLFILWEAFTVKREVLAVKYAQLNVE